MTNIDPSSSADFSDTSDSEALSNGLEGLRQDIAKLKESRRRSRSRKKQEIAKLKELKERYERDYQHELYQREKDKVSWQRTFVDKDKETKTLKRETANLRAQVKQLRIELKAKTDQLQRMGHLICDICFDREKCQVTRCGHGFCTSCLSDWFDAAAEEAMLSGEGVSVVGEASCPICRKKLHQTDDIWPTYMSEEVE
jgi:predicted RNase H-like nuclease (RuvC/YqgF family)